MFERFANSFALARSSWGVLKQDKQLVIFPILSGICCFMVLLTFIAPLSVLMVTGNLELNDDGQPPLWTYPLAFLYYFCNYFVVVFCNAALVHCALQRFDGEEPTVVDGILAAGRCLPQILAWALVSATVGVLLKMVENVHEKFGTLISAILGTAWTVITFFVVPVLVVERVGPVRAVKRSIKVLRKTWGEAAIGQAGLGLFTFLLFLPGILVLIAGVVLAGITTLWYVGLSVACLAGLYLLLCSAVSSALGTIYLSALYDFAAFDHVPQGFRKRALREAFAEKR
jgi:hypothetical protein